MGAVDTFCRADEALQSAVERIGAEQWVPTMLAGRTMPEVGADADLLGADPRVSRPRSVSGGNRMRLGG